MVDSPRILKAAAARDLGTRVAFNYEDLRERCERHLEQFREQAKQVLINAEADAENLRRSAHQQGREAGLAEGLQEADRQIEERSIARAEELAEQRLSGVLPALRAAAKSLEEERDRWLSEWEEAAVTVCTAIAEKLVRARVELNPDITERNIAAALELAAGHPRIELRLNPEDATALGDNLQELLNDLGHQTECQVTPDPEITPGGCFVGTGQGTIDAQIETQLQRIAEELLSY